MTPVEAAERALHREMGCKDDGRCTTCTIRARAALEAAIAALPEPLARGSQGPGQFYETRISKSLLRRAFGLEERG